MEATDSTTIAKGIRGGQPRARWTKIFHTPTLEPAHELEAEAWAWLLAVLRTAWRAACGQQEEMSCNRQVKAYCREMQGHLCPGQELAVRLQFFAGQVQHLLTTCPQEDDDGLEVGGITREEEWLGLLAGLKDEVEDSIPPLKETVVEVSLTET